MKKIFMLLLIVCQVFLIPQPLRASCNQSINSKTFKIHGTKENRVVIEGTCLDELLNAIGKGKDIDISYAEIKGDIDFTKFKSFPTPFDEVEKYLSHDQIAYIKPQKIIPIEGNINITNSIIAGKVQAVLYSEDSHIIRFYKIKLPSIFKKRINFENTQFFRPADFGGTKFIGGTKFSGAQFHGWANFGYAQFDGWTNFGSVQFIGSADFKYAKFNGEAYFEGAKFARRTDFWHTQFAVNAFFDSARFSRGANFTDAQFAEEASFNWTQFDEIANFNNARFIGSADFKYAKFAEGVDFHGAEFTNCSFNTTLFGLRSIYVKEYLTRKNMMKIISKDIDVNIKNIESLKWKVADYEDLLVFPQQDLSKKLSSSIFMLIQAYRVAISEGTEIKGLSGEDLLPEVKIAAISDSETIFNSATFSKFADFKNALFLGDVDFLETKFKEGGFFDGCSFFNAKTLGLVSKNNKNSLVNLNIDKSYFNLLKGLSYEQIFPHLHKRLNYLDNEQNRQIVRDRMIENYIYLQENFRKIGRFEDADLIYYQRKLLEAEKETNNWKRFWNWCLDNTCKYGIDFKQVVKVSIYLIGIFTLLYFCTIFSSLQKNFGSIEIKDKDPWIEKEKPSIVHNSIKPSKFKRFTGIIKFILKHLWHAFYLSVNTFTTVGTGDIFATRLFRVLVLVEGALGWFMLGLFIVVFSAKFLR